MRLARKAGWRQTARTQQLISSLSDTLNNIKPIKAMARILPGLRWHHERMNGGGYPDGLAGERIPLMARIIAVADTFDAITTARNYRSAMSWDEAFAELHRCRHWWSSEVFEAFVAVIGGEDGTGQTDTEGPEVSPQWATSRRTRRDYLSW